MVAEIAREGMGLHIVRRDAWLPLELQRRIEAWSPKSELGKIVRLCFGHLPPELAAELLQRITSTLVVESSLAAVHIRWDERLGKFVRDRYGVVSRKVITTAGVGFLVDAWQNSLELEIMRYHALGTGGTAEDVGDTALVTELTTEYTGNVRATGTLAEGAANVFVSVGTNTLDSGTPAITEHGVFSASSAGVLWDRSLFSAINLVGANGDALQTTYSMTASAGG